MRFKKLYDTLIENEELTSIFPHLSGDWIKDKKQFILEQQQMEDLSEFVELEDEEEYYG